MFLGVVPDALIEQITHSIDFATWRSVHVCCSGTFRMERGVLAQHSDARIFSNDVSVFTVPIGRYLLGRETPLTFMGELAFVEDILRDAPYLARIAAVMVASDMGKYAAGTPNRYKAQYLRHYRTNFAVLVKATEEKLKKTLDGIAITDFVAGDWVEHARRAVEAGGGVAAFPPFFKAGYEKMFEWIGANIAWEPPRYPLYDPKSLPGIVDEIEASGAPYCILTDQTLEGREPVIEYLAGRRLPHYCYSSEGRASFFRSYYAGKSFVYDAIDLSRVTAQSRVTVTPTAGEQVAYIKDIYLAKGIVHSSGRFNFFIHIDGMLVGALIYDNEKYGAQGSVSGLYLLSDVSISRDAKLSKLVAKMALSRSVISVMEKRDLKRFGRVTTTAFTKHPVSMKYRGIFQKTTSRPSTNPLDEPGTNILQYAAEPIADTPQQIFDWWWSKYGKAEMGKARNRAAQNRPQNAAQA